MLAGCQPVRTGMTSACQGGHRTKGIDSKGSNSCFARGRSFSVLMCLILPGLTLLLSACDNETGPVASHVI